MGRKKYQANCRIQHRRRKRAKRAALLAAEASAAAAQKGEGVEGEGQGTAAATASHTASELPTEQVASPPNPPQNQKTPKPKPKIKAIGVRERLRVVEQVVNWVDESYARKGQELKKKMRQLEQQNLTLQAEVCNMKRAFFHELAHQKGINRQLQHQRDTRANARTDSRR